MFTCIYMYFICIYKLTAGWQGNVRLLWLQPATILIWYKIFIIENFHTSIPVAEKLLSKYKYSLNTKKSRRNLLKNITSKQIKQKRIVGNKTENGIVVSIFKDKRDILLLSTGHQLDIVDRGKNY